METKRKKFIVQSSNTSSHFSICVSIDPLLSFDIVVSEFYEDSLTCSFLFNLACCSYFLGNKR